MANSTEDFDIDALIAEVVEGQEETVEVRVADGAASEASSKSGKRTY